MNRPDPALPTGTSVFEFPEGTDVLAVSDGLPPSDPYESAGMTEENPLSRAWEWLDTWWTQVDLVDTPRFAPDDEVMLVPGGQHGVIRGRSFVSGTWAYAAYAVRTGGRTIQILEQALLPPPADEGPDDWVLGGPAPVARFAATLIRAKLRESLSDTLNSFRASRTVFRPYQFRPVVRLLAAAPDRDLRLLIADEVGLGKTSEAGLVWTELDARNQANRVLIVCPSMLVNKWKREMDERFGFDVVNAQTRAGADDRLD